MNRLRNLDEGEAGGLREFAKLVVGRSQLEDVERPPAPKAADSLRIDMFNSAD